MILHTVTYKAIALLGPRTDGPSFPFVVAVCAFLATITLTVPVELLVATAVLINPARWISTALFAAVGSALASLALYLVLHHFGWGLLIEWYPEIVTSKAWLQSTRWLSQYGPVALFAIMALPLPVPKTPALAFVAIYRMPIYEVVLAIGLGKMLKYTLYAWVIAQFPTHAARWYGAALPGKAFIAHEPGRQAPSVSTESTEGSQDPPPANMKTLGAPSRGDVGDGLLL